MREDDLGELTLRLSLRHGMGKHRCLISRWRRDVRDVHEEHKDYVGKLRWSSRREKGQYRSNDAREDDLGELTLTLSSRQEKGRKECKNGGRNEAEDSGMQNGGRKDMREDE